MHLVRPAGYGEEEEELKKKRRRRTMKVKEERIRNRRERETGRDDLRSGKKKGITLIFSMDMKMRTKAEREG